MSRDTIASGAARTRRTNLRLWIENPDAIKPGSLMPAMKLSDAELDALVRVHADAALSRSTGGQPCRSDAIAIDSPRIDAPTWVETLHELGDHRRSQAARHAVHRSTRLLFLVDRRASRRSIIRIQLMFRTTTSCRRRSSTGCSRCTARR